MDKKKLIVSLTTTLLVVIILIGVAYALLRFKLTGEKNQVLRIGDLELKLDETGNTLGLESGEILSDEEGLSLQGFDFTLKNDSTKTVDYTIYLDDVELDSPTDVRLDDKYLKYSLDKNGVKGEVKPLTDTGINPERVLEKGRIGKGKQNDYTLRIWVTSDIEGDITDQVFKAKIRVENTLIPSDIDIENNDIVLDLNGKREEQININKEGLGEITYRSLDSQVAEVTPEGLITAVGLGSTEIEVTSGSFKEVVNVKVQKTVEAIYVKQGLGVQEIEREKDSCVLTSKEEVCEKTLPTITMKSDEYTAVGWNLVKDSEKGQTGSITFQDNVTYYAISYKNEVLYKVLFNGNGNVIAAEEKSCNLPKAYNDTPQQTSCEVTTPVITPHSNTPTIIGYSGEKDTYVSQVGSNASLTVDSTINGKTYYAQTKAEEKVYHVIYEKTTGVKDIGKETDQCTIKETFNGEIQDTSCTVAAPSITEESGYEVIGWSTKSGDTTGIKEGQKLTLTDVTTTYYALVKSTTKTAVDTLLSSYTNADSLQDYSSSTEDQKKKMYVFDHEQGEQQIGYGEEDLKDYRYIGKEPNNYVTFNDETWRIIGVFTVENATGKKEKRIKLIRDNYLDIKLPWDSKDRFRFPQNQFIVGRGYANWEKATLRKILNPPVENDEASKEQDSSLYWNSTNGFCYQLDTCDRDDCSNASNGFSCDFTNSGLKEDAKELIGDTVWYLGNVNSSISALSKTTYQEERSLNINTNYPYNWTGHIGLMYVSDYGYATSGGNNISRSECLDSTVWKNSACYENNWLVKNGSNEITLTTISSDLYGIISIKDNIFVRGSCVDSFNVRPVIYLKSSVEIESGDGSSKSPFVFKKGNEKEEEKPTTYTVRFVENGNTISETSKTCTIGEDGTCTVTTPTITAPSNTPNIIGFNRNRTATTSEVGSGETLVVTSENNGFIYYAITKGNDEVIKQVTYQKTEGVSSIGKESDTCTIPSNYNGKNQETTCTVQAPTISVLSTYKVIGWNTVQDATIGISPGSSLTLEKESTTYYALAKIRPVLALEKLLSNYTNEESLQNFQFSSNIQRKKMYVFDHSNKRGTNQEGYTTSELKDYRYIGKEPNNYINFNDEIWRIIGIFTVNNQNGTKEKKIKIIRDEKLTPYLAWDINENLLWNSSTIANLLNNGLYWNRGSGTCYGSASKGNIYESTTCNFTSVGLSGDAKKMISETVWYTGTTENYVLPTADHYYYERSGEFLTWLGNIGLMYPSDFGYATSGGTEITRNSCLENDLYLWSNMQTGSKKDCYENDWMLDNTWTMNFNMGNLNEVYALYDVFPTISTSYPDSSYGVKPVVYLNPDLYYVKGDGSSSSPFEFSVTEPTTSSISIDAKKEIIETPTKVCYEEVKDGASYQFSVNNQKVIKTGNVCIEKDGNTICGEYNDNLDVSDNKSYITGSNIEVYSKDKEACAYTYVCDENNKCSAKREC